MAEKKRQTPEEFLAELVATDEKFRRLHDKVVEMNGGRLPTREERDRRLEEKIASYRELS
jgi:hypothetical protein